MALDTGSEINSRNDNMVKGFIGFEYTTQHPTLFDKKRQPETELVRL